MPCPWRVRAGNKERYKSFTLAITTYIYYTGEPYADACVPTQLPLVTHSIRCCAAGQTVLQEAWRHTGCVYGEPLGHIGSHPTG